MIAALLAVLLTFAGGQTAKVVRVVDGDTIHVVRQGKHTSVRLIGIDTPELRARSACVRRLAREAQARTYVLADSRKVRLELDPTQPKFDKYGRLLAYVWLPDGTMLNKRLITEGYAREYTYRDVAYRYQKQFKQAQLHAPKRRC